VPLTVGEQQMVRIPASSVVRQGQLTGVFIVDDKNIARFHLIRTGRQFGEQMEVISGLRDGTRVVTAPPVQLTNGSAVEIAK
jgi:multidrug efflux pump subunit AcrA (membrane-fusion protein)